MDKFRVGMMDDGFFERLERSGSLREAFAGCTVREMSLEELAERVGAPMESVELSEHADAPGGSDNLSDWMDIPEEFEGGDADKIDEREEAGHVVNISRMSGRKGHQMNAKDEQRMYKKLRFIMEELVEYLFFGEGWMTVPDMTLEELAYKMSIFDDVYAWNPKELDSLKDSKMRRRFILDFVAPDGERIVDWSDVVKLPDDYDEYHAMVTEIGNRIAKDASKRTRTIEVTNTYRSSPTPYSDYMKSMSVDS